MDTIAVTKFISLLAYPLGLATLFLCFALIVRLLGRRRLSSLSLIIVVLILLIFSNSHIAKKLASSLEQQYPQQALDAVPVADAVVVLGGMIRLPIAPSLYSQLGSGSDRLWHAARLYHAGKADKVIILGGNVFHQEGAQSEAYYAAQILQQWDVPEQAILIEQGSRTTAQNANNLERLLISINKISETQEHKNLEVVLLVTSALHMPRAIKHFQSQSVKIIPVSADVLIQNYQRPQILSWIPSASALQLSTVAMHEYYGMWFEQIKSLFETRVVN